MKNPNDEESDIEFSQFKEKILTESASAFYTKANAQKVVNALNGDKKDGPFYAKEIEEGLYQIAYKTKNLKEQYFKDIQIFDKIFVMPGEKGCAKVWIGLQQYCVNKGKDGKLVSKINIEGNKTKRTKTPVQLYRPEVKKAILDATQNQIDEDIKPFLAAGILGASSLFGSGYREQPYEKALMNTKIEKKDSSQATTKILDPKRYAAYLIQQEGDPLLVALAKHESKNDPSAVGDKNLKDHAYGILQIRKPAVIDVNEKFGTNYVVEDLVPSDPHDRAEIEKAVNASIDIYKKYLARYKMSDASNEAKAKFWNGGPVTKKIATDLLYREKYKTIATNVDKYWKKIQTEL